jgi:[ribosomal protein S18]-alanine N-acetyltransferase
MNLRAVEMADVEALARLHAATFERGWPAQEMASLLASPGVFGLVCEAADGPCGMILCRAAAGEAEILTIGVAPSTRRGGVGLALVQAAAGLAETLGAQSVFLEVAADNPAALALYRRAGFEAVGVRARYYARTHGPAVDAQVMRRTLNS